MKSTQEQKSLLRKKIISKRKSLTNMEIEAKSMFITRKLLGMSQIASTNNVLLYIPINGEVDTKYVLGHFQKKKINIFLPAYKKEDKNWVVSKLENLDSLEIGPFGIMQPRGAYAFRVSVLDLVIIPIVAFNKELYRLGYGKGVYDRLLSSSVSLKIGLAYDFQLVSNLPVESQDIRMDFVVTESEIVS